jgi:hypothetical protein
VCVCVCVCVCVLKSRHRRDFTADEDVAIINYVLQTDRSVKGNTIYREIEEKLMPDRSWQSIRGRFLKVRCQYKHHLPQTPTTTVVNLVLIVVSMCV